MGGVPLLPYSRQSRWTPLIETPCASAISSFVILLLLSALTVHSTWLCLSTACFPYLLQSPSQNSLSLVFLISLCILLGRDGEISG
jgi:hypothetical protein